jgi:cell division protein FtsL
MRQEIKNSATLNMLLALAAVSVGIGAIRMAGRTRDLNRELHDARAKLEATLRQKAEVFLRLAELEAPEAIEREAKAKFDLKKPGEEVVVVVPEERRHPSPQVTLWERIKRFFAGIF